MDNIATKKTIAQKAHNYMSAYYKSIISFLRSLKFDIVFAAIYIAALTSPTVSAFTRTKFGYPVVFAIYITWFISCIVRARKKGKKFLIDKSRIAEVVAMVVWIVFITLTFLIGRGENGYWALIYTMMFMTVYMIDYLYSIYNERYVLKGLMYVALFVFALHSLISAFMLAKAPLLAREFNAYFFEDINYYAPFEYKGLGSYTFFTALAIAIPVFIFLAAKLRHRILATILVLLCIAGCFYSAYAGIIIILMIALFMMIIYALIFYKNKTHKRAMIIILALSVILIVNLFAWMLPHTTNEMYKAKLRDLILATTEIDIAPNVPHPSQGDPTDKEADIIYNENSRIEFYKVSIKTIGKHPLFGVGPYFKTETVANGIGNHSSWLDYLAMYGAIGCLPLIAFFILYFRRTMVMSSFTANKIMRLFPWMLFMGYGLLNPVFTAKNFPVVLMLLAAGALPSGQLVKFLDVFRRKPKEL